MDQVSSQADLANQSISVRPHRNEAQYPKNDSFNWHKAKNENKKIWSVYLFVKITGTRHVQMWQFSRLANFSSCAGERLQAVELFKNYIRTIKHIMCDDQKFLYLFVTLSELRGCSEINSHVGVDGLADSCHRTLGFTHSASAVRTLQRTDRYPLS